VTADFPVISGYGVVSALGGDTTETGLALAAGSVRPAPAEGFFPPSFAAPCFQVAERVFLPQRGDGGGNRTIGLALRVVAEALARAGLSPAALAGRRVGIALGTTVGCTFHNEEYYRRWRLGENPETSPVTAYLGANLATALQAILGVTGPRAVIANACASGSDAIGLAGTWLRQGRCELAIAGGADELSRVACHGFKSLLLVAEEPCRPFDRDRRGLNLGEGAAVLVLEREEGLRARGGPCYGWLRGYGAAGDAHHPTAPHPEGRGLQQAVAGALAESRLGVADIAMINAHGTGTPANDLAESRAIAALGLAGRPVVSTKGATGHTLGAAGAIETVLTLLALNTGRLQGTIGCGHPDPELACPILAAGEEVTLAGRVGLKQSLAFGGGNAALVIEGVG
jgi:3-oxoacyl-(acyl-carrier-protein) synthase